MAKLKRMMETDESTGIKRQFFPISHVSAILGLNEIIAGNAPVLSVNGKIGAIVLTKEDFGLENVITELPYAGEEQDGIITAEMYQAILNSDGGEYVIPIATVDSLGAIKVGDLLTIDETGRLSAVKQSDTNFTEALKEKLESLNIYTAGANISISESGVISATGGGEGGGVSQEYVDQKATETYQSAKDYTDSKIPVFSFEKIGEV